MKKMKKISCLVLAALMAALLAGCTQKAEVTEDGDGYTTGYDKGYTDGYAAALAGTEETSSQDTALYPFYESENVCITVDPVREDSTYTHVTFHAVNRTGKDLSLSLNGIALNGYSMDTGYEEALPANGTVWLTVPVSKEQTALVENFGTVGRVKALFCLYDEEYACVETILSEASFSEGAAEAPAQEGGELLYGEDDLVIRYLGNGEDEDGTRYCRLYVENGTERSWYLSTVTGATSAEKIGPGYYGTILPGTKAVGRMYLYTGDYMKVLDPEELSYVSVLFRIIDMENSDETKLTDPLKITLGGTGRYTVSDDGRELTVKETSYIYDDAEWLAVSSDEAVLAVDSVEAIDANDGMTQMCVAKFKPVSEGEVTVHIYYHPVGESVEETDDFYPTLYVDREMKFSVGSDGTVSPGEVTFSVEDYQADGSVIYQYRLDKDGNMIHKFVAEE